MKEGILISVLMSSSSGHEDTRETNVDLGSGLQSGSQQMNGTNVQLPYYVTFRRGYRFLCHLRELLSLHNRCFFRVNVNE